MLVENNEKLIDGIAGIPDENFIRGNVPMTKREIRASIASRMHVSKMNVYMILEPEQVQSV